MTQNWSQIYNLIKFFFWVLVRTSGAKLRIQLKSNWIFSLFHLLLFIYIYIYIYYTNLSLLIGIKKNLTLNFLPFHFYTLFFHISLYCTESQSIHFLNKKKKKNLNPFSCQVYWPTCINGRNPDRKLDARPDSIKNLFKKPICFIRQNFQHAWKPVSAIPISIRHK